MWYGQRVWHSSIIRHQSATWRPYYNRHDPHKCKIKATLTSQLSSRVHKIKICARDAVHNSVSKRCWYIRVYIPFAFSNKLYVRDSIQSLRDIKSTDNRSRTVEEEMYFPKFILTSRGSWLEKRRCLPLQRTQLPHKMFTTSVRSFISSINCFSSFGRNVTYIFRSEDNSSVPHPKAGQI
jgi:hypothetical protein